MASTFGSKNKLVGGQTLDNGKWTDTATGSAVAPAPTEQLKSNLGTRTDDNKIITQGSATYNGIPKNTTAPVVKSPASSQSTTTLSSGNKINQVINNKSTLDSLANRGTTTDADGNARYSNGDFVQDETEMADTSKEDSAITRLLNQMKGTTDSVAANQISGIQSSFGIRKQQQEAINQQQEKRVQNALLMGGVTGQGSSAQFAPVSSEGIIQAQESYGIQQLANLDAQEQSLIATARAAQEAGQYKIMEAKIEQVQKTRDEKVKLASKLNDQIIARNKVKQEEFDQSIKDNAVAEIYAKGITDPASIAGKLKKQGIVATSKNIADAIKNIVPDGLDDLMKTVANNGAPASVIQAVLGAKNLAEAYKAAGSYAAGGTGDLAEYNLAKAQGYTGSYLEFLGDKEDITSGLGSYNDVFGQTSGAGTGAKNAAKVAGITDTTVPLSQAIVNVGLDAIVNGIIANEGNSVKGVINNPGNIKFRGMQGQTDSGIKASDGGTFSNYATQQEGKDAIGRIVQSAADGKSSVYGQNPTFEQFMNKYTNTAPKSDGSAQALQTILGSIKFTKDQKADVINAVKNGQDAFTVIKNKARDILGTEGKDVVALERAKAKIEDIDSLLKEYTDKGGKTSYLSGSFENVLNKVGQVNDPELKTIAVKVALALQAYRNAVSGTAYSVKEGQEIASVFPSIKNGQVLNDAIIKGTVSSMQNDIDTLYRTVIGDSYDKMKTANNPTEAVVQNEDNAKQSVIDYSLKNANKLPEINAMMDSGLYKYSDVAQILGINI